MEIDPPAAGSNRPISHSSHWGAFGARTVNGELVIVPNAEDPNPSPLLENIPKYVAHKTRVAHPYVRRTWLESGPGSRSRDDDDFVRIDWDHAADLVASELQRVGTEFGNQAIFGGSYGWSSAGRFHHAQSQLHRFLNCTGGYTRSVNSYSIGAAEVILPRILAPAFKVARDGITWAAMTETELIVTFGGMASKNFQVASGGLSQHESLPRLRELRSRGCKIVSISPLADDFDSELGAEHIWMKPFGDVPLMLALAYVLLTTGTYDSEFIERCTVGFDEFERYVLGNSDGIPKDPQWAFQLCGVDPREIVSLAERMANNRTVVNVSYSLQRSAHGEQPVWLGIVLASLIGQIGLPGGGFAFGLGSMGNNGSTPMSIRQPSLPQGNNAVSTYIPVAKFSEMLLNPGAEYDYNGERLQYPDIKLVYWAGGNPFHHSHDLNRLRRAFERPETIIVHEPFWTTSARYADIVLPSTITLERNDFGAGHGDHRLIAMKQVLEPFAEARDDYEIFSEIAARIGLKPSFTEGRSSDDWIRTMYDELSRSLSDQGQDPPEFDEFWSRGWIEIPKRVGRDTVFADFRRSPEEHPLSTPSGKIEIYSSTIAGFEYADCPGHPVWLDSPERVSDDEYRGGYLQLIANNPRTRLHSQLDMGAVSQGSKVSGREPVRLNPTDAADRGIRNDDLVLISNSRGSCLAGAVLSGSVMQGTIQLSTGAWYEPVELFEGEPTCVHGNPNVLTSDETTSSLGQGSAGQLSKVKAVRYEGEAPEVTVTKSPPIS